MPHLLHDCTITSRPSTSQAACFTSQDSTTHTCDATSVFSQYHFHSKRLLRTRET